MMIIYSGSVDDIKSSLKLAENKITIKQLQNNIEAEMKYKGRASVINMLNASISRKIRNKKKGG